MEKLVLRQVTLALCGLALASGAVAQQYVYPAKGQSAEQQKKDESECHTWAVTQTGVDPTKPPPQAAAPAAPSTPTRVPPASRAAATP